MKDRHNAGVTTRRIDHVRVGDRLDLAGDMYADGPDPDPTTGLKFEHPEFEFEYQTVSGIESRPNGVNLIFESDFTCVFPYSHWVEVDGEQEREEVVPVIFRATSDGQVTAVFPTHPGDRDSMVCYAHVGQHSSCTLGWYRATQPARVADYKPLQAELEGAPYFYKLKVYRRITRQHRDAFNETVRGLNRKGLR